MIGEQPAATAPIERPHEENPEKPAWEVVHPPPHPNAEVAAAGAATSGRAAWELDPGSRQEGEGRRRESIDVEDDEVHESLVQTVLSYAGLVVALIVILLGIVIMIGAKP